MPDTAAPRAGRARAMLRVGWTVLSFLVVQMVVCGLSVLPVLMIWQALLSIAWVEKMPRLAIAAFAVAPSYVLFALLLMIVSPAATFLLRWRTAPGLALRLADLDWPVLTWVRYVSAIRVVRVFSGTLFCGSPIWTGYLRLNGARIGRRVYVNTLYVSDHNLLDLDDDVVIGAAVHLSGHTVEAGIVRTGLVKLGRSVTVGVGSVIDIDVEAGAGCQIGAFSFVPKHARLEAGAVYVGIPVRRLS